MTNLMLIGEAWGKDEEPVQRPFVGKAGWLLNGLLAQAGIRREECYVTNVFNLRPKPTDDVKNLCGPKVDGIPGMPALVPGKYVKAQYLPHLTRLYKEIEVERPNLIVALGVTASWALMRQTVTINSIRGSIGWSKHVGTKILPTYHPAGIFRDYSGKPILFADLCKAKGEALFPELRLPVREVWTAPTPEDLLAFESSYITPSSQLSIDIETMGEMISCIGFAPDAQHAIVVPFYDAEKKSGNYWDTLEEEVDAMSWVRRMCSLPKRMIFQNGLFDIQRLWRYGIPVPGAEDDTMLLHHALQPEMRKSLGFLASVYSNEPSWKFMRKSMKKEDAE